MDTDFFFEENCPISRAALETLSVPVLAPELSPPHSQHPSTGSETSCSSRAHRSDRKKGKHQGEAGFSTIHEKPTRRVSACLPSTAITLPGEAVIFAVNSHV